MAGEVVAVLLGPKWLAAGPLIRLFLCRRRAAIRYARATAGEVAILVLCPNVDCAAGAAVLGAIWGGAAGMIVFYTAAYCAVMILLTSEAVVELKGRICEVWSQTWAIMAVTAAMTVVVLIFGELAAPMQVESPFVRLVLLSFAAAATYGATLFAIGSAVISEGAEVLGWILRPRRAQSGLWQISYDLF